jgi:DNA helicase-2/ATP-dependent DNA helicase PcrA
VSAPDSETERFGRLGDEQRAIADSPASDLLVLGGAGTGKTTTALWAARRHLLGRGARTRPARGNRVLMIAFSRTAVGQIRERARGVLDGLDGHIEISTFHSLSYRLISAFPTALGLSGPPAMQSEAREKLNLPGPDAAALRYSQLMPLATQLLTTPGPIAKLITNRWSLVIADEFQDTSDEEWELLSGLSQNARTILLGDENQMIYDGFKQGVAGRLDATRATGRYIEITLPPISHRDPTQLIPALATEVRNRVFDGPALLQATTEARVQIRTDVDESYETRIPMIQKLLGDLEASGHATFGVYGRGNVEAAELSAHLLACGVRHVPVGFGEAFGEAVVAQMAMIDYATGAGSWEDVRIGLAIALTAAHRGKEPPAIALGLRYDQGLPQQVTDGLGELATALQAAATLTDSAAIAADARRRIAITDERNWTRAGDQLVTAAYRAEHAGPGALDHLRRIATDLRTASVVSGESNEAGAVQVMNFNQTKGRQADAVILNCLSSDWYGHASEPWASPSRLLYVALTRAEKTIVILLPSHPHQLFRPFATVPAPPSG